MSADNFLGIYKVNARKYIGRSCMVECERDCKHCSNTPKFTARSMKEAIKLAQDEIGREIYEYGFMFLNI